MNVHACAVQSTFFFYRTSRYISRAFCLLYFDARSDATAGFCLPSRRVASRREDSPASAGEGRSEGCRRPPGKAAGAGGGVLSPRIHAQTSPRQRRRARYGARGCLPLLSVVPLPVYLPLPPLSPLLLRPPASSRLSRSSIDVA